MMEMNYLIAFVEKGFEKIAVLFENLEWKSEVKDFDSVVLFHVHSIRSVVQNFECNFFDFFFAFVEELAQDIRHFFSLE